MDKEISIALIGAAAEAAKPAIRKAKDIEPALQAAYFALRALVLENSAGPAPDIADSVHDDYIICLEDGKKLKMLKRYIKTRYGMNEKEYRLKWRLPPDYPMVAPNYAKKRSMLAKKHGLGKPKAA
ncbi:MAG: MucR family transcriptional regulator [Rickettsiales bacterium]|jgi:predicted transcriptional regulator|nr:MucR family transcriptional regulator [Rickettsiales bacterium]